MLISEASFVVTDTETTGCRPGHHHVIEIGAVRVRDGAVVDTFSELIDPGVPIPPFITRLTGISTQMVAGRPGASSILPQYAGFLADGVFVAHNLSFDLRFIEAEHARVGLGGISNPALCTLRLARRILPMLPSKALHCVADHFRVVMENRHRALGDARATAEVFICLLDLLEREYGIRTLQQLLAFQNRRYAQIHGEPPHVREIRKTVLPQIPEAPGVYRMRDARGTVVYVGKARSLRSRVRAYFSGIDHHPSHVRRLVQAVRAIEWDVLPSEIHALLTESELIKQLQPRFNRALRAITAYPFICLTEGSPPGLSICFSIDEAGGLFYGPFDSIEEAERIAAMLCALFGLDYSGTEGQRARQFKPFRTQRRTAVLRPLIPHGSEQAFELCRDLLGGSDLSAINHIKVAMTEAAGRMDYESAGQLRDAATLLERTAERGAAAGGDIRNRSLTVAEKCDDRYALVYSIRNGRIAGAERCLHDEISTVAAGMALSSASSTAAARSTFDRFDEADHIRVVAQWLYRERDRLETVSARTDG